jgi:hypothetical protein
LQSHLFLQEENKEMINYETSLLRWKENRDKCTVKDFFYKESTLEQARQGFLNNHPVMVSLCNSIKEKFGYLLETDSEYLIRMIEDTTPGPCHMNLSPEHDFGVPHGVWTWDPKDPDVIVDEITKTRFPNDKYPETGVLETHWGRPQRFTFYTGKSILYNRYHIFASFSGKVRFYKVQYMTEVAYNLAFLYRLTGHFPYAQKAREILLRFAEVYPYWLAHGMYGDIADMDPRIAGQDPANLPYPRTCLPPNESIRSIHVGYWSLGRATASGQEGGGFLLPMCITYSLIADAVSPENIPLFTQEERYKIEKDILLEGISLVVNDTKLNNKSCSNRFAALAVGILTGVEEYIRFGLEGFFNIVEDWYLKDGSTSESPSYSMMVMNSMWIASELIDGCEKITRDGKPFDVYRWDKYRAVWKGMYDTLLQNCQYPPSADCRMGTKLSPLYIQVLAHRFGNPEYKALLKQCPEVGLPSRSMYHFLPDLDEAPKQYDLIFRDQYFPDFGQAYLRIGKNNQKGTFILYATDWGIHHHMDSLNIFYYWNGNEWLSDLGYLWDQPERYMTVRTAAHNLVVIDEKDQIREGRGGDLNRFVILPEKWKIADASSHAYPDASVYRRAVMLCEHSPDHHYILDLFRVQGGEVRDLLLHGPSMDYTIENAESGPWDEKLPYELKNAKRLSSTKDLTITWKGKDRNLFGLHIPENGSKNERILMTEGWGQRGVTDVGAVLPYLMRRHEGKDPHTFITIYSSSENDPFVLSSRCFQSQDENMVLCEVQTQSGKDLLVYRFGPGETVVDTPYGSLEYDGAAAWIQDTKDPKVYLYGGGALRFAGREWKACHETLTGDIESFDENGFYVSVPYDQAKDWIGRSVYIQNDRRNTGYLVKGIIKEKEGSKILTRSEDGDGFSFLGGRSWRMDDVTIYE